jgi:hemoglobin-like flavoprotein
LSTAAELDPKFRRLYTNGSGLTLFQRNGVVTKETVKATIDLLERGAREFPEDGEIAFQLGFMHYYEMEPFLPEEKDDPKRRFHKEHGARLIRQAALMDGVPSYAALLSTSLLNKEGLDDLMIEHLKAMLVKETNPVVRETLLHQLRREVGKAAEREIELSEKLVARWRANMPFVPFDIYVLIDRDYPVEELIDPLWWSNRYLGLVEESQDVDGVDTIEEDKQDGDLP